MNAALETASRRLVDVTTALSRLQAPDGGIPHQHKLARQLLEEVADAIGAIPGSVRQREMAHAFRTDSRAWGEVGLQKAPSFLHVRETLQPPENGDVFGFAGPVVVPNGAHNETCRFEAFCARREEPVSVQDLTTELPHPGSGCQSMRLLAGTSGYMLGNGIVFFPENVSAQSPMLHQDIAFFFLNKFEWIYRERTLVYAQRALARNGLFGNSTAVSSHLQSSEIYSQRCIWAYLHDYYHGTGPRPLHLHIWAKTHFHSGALEELRVDAKTIAYLWRVQHPARLPITEMVLLERMLRYPQHPHAERNFDAASGVFLFEWLREENALTLDGDGKIRLDLGSTLRSLEKLVRELEDLEQFDDRTYLAIANAFAQAYIGCREGAKRYVVPQAYENALKGAPADSPLDFNTIFNRLARNGRRMND